jgi:hypothetical protein
MIEKNIYEKRSYGGRAIRSLTDGKMRLVVVVVQGNGKSLLNKYDIYDSKFLTIRTIKSLFELDF